MSDVLCVICGGPADFEQTGTLKAVGITPRGINMIAAATAAGFCNDGGTYIQRMGYCVDCVTKHMSLFQPGAAEASTVPADAPTKKVLQ